MLSHYYSIITAYYSNITALQSHRSQSHRCHSMSQDPTGHTDSTVHNQLQSQSLRTRKCLASFPSPQRLRVFLHENVMQPSHTLLVTTTYSAWQWQWQQQQHVCQQCCACHLYPCSMTPPTTSTSHSSWRAQQLIWCPTCHLHSLTCVHHCTMTGMRVWTWQWQWYNVIDDHWWHHNDADMCTTASTPAAPFPPPHQLLISLTAHSM